MFEVICSEDINEQYVGKSLFLCRKLDDLGGTIFETQFVLDELNNIVVNKREIENTDKHLSYRHAEIIDVKDGEVELKDMPYKCIPLPVKSKGWTVLRHVGDGKDWAIGQLNSTQASALFRNEHTSNRWIHALLDEKLTVAERINEKIGKGYCQVFIAKKTWNSPSRSFS